jgi:hypothetical protein
LKLRVDVHRDWQDFCCGVKVGEYDSVTRARVDSKANAAGAASSILLIERRNHRAVATSSSVTSGEHSGCLLACLDWQTRLLLLAARAPPSPPSDLDREALQLVATAFNDFMGRMDADMARRRGSAASGSVPMRRSQAESRATAYDQTAEACLSPLQQAMPPLAAPPSLTRSAQVGEPKVRSCYYLGSTSVCTTK